MSTKSDLLKILEEASGSYVSGEEIARICGASRSAIWKAARALKSDGYVINAVTNKGYSLSVSNDVVTEEHLKAALGDCKDSFFPVIYKSLTSTNDEAKTLAAIKKAPEWTVVISCEQTKGRGRGDHSFFSPPGTGLYMSIILRPSCSASKSLMITTAAAVAVALAVDSVRNESPDAAFLSGSPALIKWVNDIYIGERKVCGILTEASLDFESGGIEYAVLGIGINVFAPNSGFPADISGSAGSLFSSGAGIGNVRCHLAAEILKNFRQIYSGSFQDLLKEYKKRSMLIGKGVTVLADPPYKALAKDIDDDFHLIVRREDGTIDSLASGEVSVKQN